VGPTAPAGTVQAAKVWAGDLEQNVETVPREKHNETSTLNSGEKRNVPKERGAVGIKGKGFLDYYCCRQKTVACLSEMKKAVLGHT